jgi:hypothetical protein
MFLATALLYPCALAALCVGAGLAVDRLSGAFMPACLLLSVGAAALIGLSQLTTCIAALAPATPYALLALALAGFALGWRRARGWLRHAWLPGVSILAFALALAPVLAGGRTSFSSYMALADSAVHMMGADYLIRHGQDYAHLDLRNSYGQFVHDYYGIGYPSGADTLFGGSADLLGLPLIWAFQPFNAFMLASSAGPAWLLARRTRLAGAWAALAALTAVAPALVYGYELLGSIKEVTALSMLLTLGALTVEHRRWLAGPPARAAPFALVLAAGVSALGLAFGAWALAAVLVLAGVLASGSSAPAPVAAAPRRAPGSASSRTVRRRRTPALVAVAALTLLVAAWPTWRQLPSALRIAKVIAATSNAGNLHAPLRAIQVLGVWLNGSYKLAPAGAALVATHALVALAIAAAVLGGAHLLRIRAFALVAWLASMLAASLAVSESVSTWAEAKTLVLTSPIAVLLAWAGVAALRSLSQRALASALAALLALGLAGGVLASDALQYHSSDIAPTARYQELASLDSRFAGDGPALFTDFDEYSLYELRDLDVGGPDFVYPPPALADAAGGYGRPVDLGRAAPAALLAYPLVITRRDPAASRPPAAYRLVWQGAYYQVWRRRAGAPPARAHVALSGYPAAQCRRIAALARRGRPTERLLAAQAPPLVSVTLARASHPAGWTRAHEGFVMHTAGSLSARFTLPHAGVWDVWVQGQIMPTVLLSIDGRAIARIGGQLDGNSLVLDTVPAIPQPLAEGEHKIVVTRYGSNLSPGAGGQAVLGAVFLTPAGANPEGPLRDVAVADWSSLCGRSYQWVELARSIGART